MITDNNTHEVKYPPKWRVYDKNTGEILCYCDNEDVAQLIAHKLGAYAQVENIQ